MPKKCLELEYKKYCLDFIDIDIGIIQILSYFPIN